MNDTERHLEELKKENEELKQQVEKDNSISGLGKEVDLIGAAIIGSLFF